ncbi:MAG: hypothetical protein GF344_11680 [Chitinivibrionales bacterium]|nr:hypothetical protein [Chitinivibrionales bacterium]MBD3357446.1 hypothetical protein [Chitinivibrionales bacterium]
MSVTDLPHFEYRVHVSGAAFLVFALLFLIADPGTAEECGFKIAVTAETHGLVRPCPCPEEPRGGLAARAAMLESINADRRLLLDAGGFSAGGPYDTYTEGRKRDSLRTLAAIRGMAAMGYDAAAVGDEELRWDFGWLWSEAQKAGLPLVCTNARLKDEAASPKPYGLISKQGKTFAIAALVTRERLFPTDTSVVVDPPFERLREIWPTLVREADYQVVLSHLGEQASIELLNEFPECDIVVNGHRKRKTLPSVDVGFGTMLQFGFQGKRMALADIRLDQERLAVDQAEWVPIHSSQGHNNEVIKVVNSVLEPARRSPSPRTTADLYMMGQCPYCLPVLRRLLSLSEVFPCIDMRLWFIGTIGGDGDLSSLHGVEEMRTEKLWLAVVALYPRMWRDFLYLQAVDKVSPERALIDMGLDTARIQRWVKEKGDGILAMHYRRSERLGIKASPTVLLDNVPFEYDSLRFRVAQKLCGTCGEGIDLCDSLPECLRDEDCRQVGKTGVCVEHEGRRRCAYREPVPFTFTVVSPDTMLWRSEEPAIATTRELFPGARIETISAGTERGRELIRRMDPAALPLYLFDTSVVRAHNYAKVAPGLVRRQNRLTFRPEAMSGHYFHRRERQPGKVTLFVDPHFDRAGEVLALAARIDSPFKRITVLPVVRHFSDTAANSLNYTGHREEGLAWLALREASPGKFTTYLRQCVMKGNEAEDKSACLKSLGFSRRRLKAILEEHGEMLVRHRDMQKTLRIESPVSLLVENRELIAVSNPKDLLDLMARVLGTEPSHNLPALTK